MAVRSNNLKNDLTGKRFGRLVVVEKTDQREKKYIVWRCRCDCGNEVLASTRSLKRGTVKNCGCVEKKDARRGNIAEDLTGQKFGHLTVCRRAENRNGRTCWLCCCDCGGSKIVSAHDLKAGKVKSCGCMTHQRGYNKADIRGQRFGRLTALYPTERRDRRGTVYWVCRCDCGKELEVSEANLASGNNKSCGCLKKENQDKIKDRLHRVDGTCVEILEKRKFRRDNKSGFRGVYQMTNGKYQVSIGFRGERISLGTYAEFGTAVSVRLDAEEKIHGGFLKAYREWEKKAEADPQWARENPFHSERY